MGRKHARIGTDIMHMHQFEAEFLFNRKMPSNLMISLSRRLLAWEIRVTCPSGCVISGMLSESACVKKPCKNRFYLHQPCGNVPVWYFVFALKLTTRSYYNSRAL